MNERPGALHGDRLQERIVRLALDLRHDTLPAEDAEAVKVRLIDTFAAAFAGHASAAAGSARRYAEGFPKPDGATLFGTTLRVTAEAAAFANATASREAEWNDVYMSRAGGGTHPSDVILPILAAAESAGAGGADLLAAIVAAYEVYMGLADSVAITGFDSAGLAGLAVAAGAGRVLGLSAEQLHQAVSICAVANNPLNQARRNQLTIWKAVAAGQAGRAGVAAAQMAQAGLVGPNLPFEGLAGWNKLVARHAYEVPALDPAADRFRIRDSLIKWRASCAVTIPSILAAEDAARQVRASDVAKVLVETYAYAKNGVGSGEHRWNPTSRESADHSIPYVVAAALYAGTVGPEQFQDAYLWNPELRALIQKVEVVENPDYTEAYARHPRQHPTRVTVTTHDGHTVVGMAGAPDHEEMGTPRPPEDTDAKFLSLAEPAIGRDRAQEALAQLWAIDRCRDLRQIPQLVAI